VHDLAPADGLDAKVNETLGALMMTSADAVREAKRLVREVAGRPVGEQLLADTAERIAAIRASDDGREGVRAFLDKRKPRWSATSRRRSPPPRATTRKCEALPRAGSPPGARRQIPTI